MAKNIVNWFQDQVVLDALEATNLEGLAFRVEERTKENITSNNQVDTGFMRSSAYIVTSEKDTYVGGSRPSSGTGSQAGMGPKVTVPNIATVAVAVGAEYAIFQEVKNSFLYRALTQAADEVGGVVKEL